jgi:hypothetical protein
MTTIIRQHPTNDISTTIISTAITRWLQRERLLRQIQWTCIDEDHGADCCYRAV